MKVTHQSYDWKLVSRTILCLLLLLVAVVNVDVTRAAPPCDDDPYCYQDPTLNPEANKAILDSQRSIKPTCAFCKLAGDIDVRVVAHSSFGYYLYVSSGATDSVLRYDGITGAFVDIFASGGGLDSPTGVAIGPDSNLYVSSARSDSVLRYNGTTGAFMGVFVLPHSGGLDAPMGLEFGPDNNLYVSSLNSDNVLRYDGLTGAFIDIFAGAGSGGLGGPIGLTFGPNGNLYVANRDTASVLRFNGMTGALINVFASGQGSTAPVDVKFGPDGNLYLSNINVGSVNRFDGTTGSFIDNVANHTHGLDGAEGLAFGPNGNLYIASVGSDEIIEYETSSGNVTGVFASGGGLDAPTFLTFGSPRLSIIIPTQDTKEDPPSIP